MMSKPPLRLGNMNTPHIGVLRHKTCSFTADYQVLRLAVVGLGETCSGCVRTFRNSGGK